MPTPIPPCAPVRTPLLRGLLVALLLGVALLPRAGRAQMPGMPVLQSGFIPVAGWAVGVDGGFQSASGAVALAGSWVPHSGRVQLVAGAGLARGNAHPGPAGGLRLAIPLFSLFNETVGTAIFGGVGADAATRASELATPYGVSIGYRHVFGATHVVALSLAPFGSFYTVKQDTTAAAGGNVSKHANTLRVSAALDAALSDRLGLTLGVESGQAQQGTAGTGISPSGLRTTRWGVGISHAF